MNKSLLHLVGSSVLLYLIDDARSNKNQIGWIFMGFAGVNWRFDVTNIEARRWSRILSQFYRPPILTISLIKDLSLFYPLNDVFFSEMELHLFISVLKFCAISWLKITKYMWDVFLLVDGGFDCVNKVLHWLCTRVYIFLLILVEIVLSVFAYLFFFLKGLKHSFLMKDSLQSVILFV